MPKTITLTRVEDTKNYAKFELLAPTRESKQVHAFGKIYLTKAEAGTRQTLTIEVEG